MTDYSGSEPPWVRTLDKAALIGSLGQATYRRGIEYQRNGMVAELRSLQTGDLHAVVSGSSFHTYQVLVCAPREYGFGHDLLIETECSCPMRNDCKHVVAAILAAKQWPTLRPRSPMPGWQKAFDPVVTAKPADGKKFAIRLRIVADRYGSPARLALHPMAEGKSTWVKTGASWRDIESMYHRTALDRRQQTLMRQLLYLHRAGAANYYGYGEQSVYIDQLSALFWPLLDQLRDAGVVLLGPDRTTQVVVATQPAELFFDLTRVNAGAVELKSQVRMHSGSASPDAIHLIGSPAHGFWVETDNCIQLVQLTSEVDPETMRFAAADAVTIPDQDLQEFFFSYYPAIKRRVNVCSSDESVALPQISGPRLELTAEFLPTHVTRLRWAYTYRLGDELRRFAVVDAEFDPGRDTAAEEQLLKTCSQDGVPWAPSRAHAGALGELTGTQTSDFVQHGLAALQAGPDIDVVLIGEPLPYSEFEGDPSVSLATTDTADPDWFDLSISVQVADEQVPLADLLQALTCGESRMLLASGTWFRLDRPELTKVREVVEEARALEDKPGAGLRINPIQAGWWDELVSLGVVTEQSQRWQRSVSALLAIDDLPRPEPPPLGGATLRPYQRDGFQWLSTLWDLQLGGVLADDMGLGKTIQTLALAAHAAQAGTLGPEAGPMLIVAPTSVMPTWSEQAAIFCPHLAVAALTATEKRGGHKIADVAAESHIVVTSYALFRIEEQRYRDVKWSALVLDEAQFVKNHQAKTYQSARQLAAPFKLAITGTPMENSLMDLWSMLSITAPGLFPNPKRFDEFYRRPIESGDTAKLDSLRRRIRPLMLRRTKEEVASDLPPKTEQVLHVPLNGKHQRVYDTHLNRERQRLLGLLDDVNRNRFEILKSLTTLRQLSLDPSLVDDSHSQLAPSAKIDLLVDQLHEIRAEGHRALVFSQFTRYLKMVRDRLTSEGITTCYLDGRTRNRQSRINDFVKGDADAFLISLKAGGFGLNLTAADYVYVMDPWWNPAAEAQAIDRTHRIGQDKPVMVYRLISTGTIEEKVASLQERKREMFRAIVDGGAAGKALDAEDLRGLLS